LPGTEPVERRWGTRCCARGAAGIDTVNERAKKCWYARYSNDNLLAWPFAQTDKTLAMTSQKLNFSLPSYFDEDVLTSSLSSCKGGIHEGVVDETYGCLSHSALGHGRASEAVAKVLDLSVVRRYREFCRSHGILFNYLINAPFGSTGIPHRHAERELTEIIQIVDPDGFTVSSLVLARILRRIAPKCSITVSTIAGIRGADDLLPFLAVSPSVIVPHHDLGRNFAKLQEVCDVARNSKAEIRLLVNESCLYDCPKRRMHYEHLAAGKNDDEFQGWCNRAKRTNPSLILESSWIRPEDTRWLSSRFGITKFKISGRAKAPDWLTETAKAYLRGSYNGNLLRLLATTPPWTKEPWEEIAISNQHLDQFLVHFPQGSAKGRRDYCEFWTRNLIGKGALVVRGNATRKISCSSNSGSRSLD
jgi:collagenase-like PrtC family protease